MWKQSVQGSELNTVSRTLCFYCRQEGSFSFISQSTNGPQETGKLPLFLPNLVVRNFGEWKTEVGYLMFPKKKQLLGRSLVHFMVSYFTKGSFCATGGKNKNEDWVTLLENQFSSVTQSCLTLCKPMNCSTPGLSNTNSRSPPKPMSIVSVMPSNHLILSSPSPPALNLSQHQGLFKRVSSPHQVAKVLEFQRQHQALQCLKIDWSKLNGHKVYSPAACCLHAQSCLTFCNPMDCSLPGSSNSP